MYVYMEVHGGGASKWESEAIFIVSILQLVSWVVTCASTDQILEQGKEEAAEAGRRRVVVGIKCQRAEEEKALLCETLYMVVKERIVFKLFQAYVTHVCF